MMKFHQHLLDHNFQIQNFKKLPPTQKKKTNPTKSCRICTKSKARKESRYFCKKCKDNPALCVDPCFRVYHQQRVEKDITSLDNEN